MQNKLLPCPFCSKKLKRIRNGYEHPSSQCVLSSFIIVDVQIDSWNTRKPMERIVEQLETELKLAEDEERRCLKAYSPRYERAEQYALGISNALDIVREGGKE